MCTVGSDLIRSNERLGRDGPTLGGLNDPTTHDADTTDRQEDNQQHESDDSNAANRTTAQAVTYRRAPAHL